MLEKLVCIDNVGVFKKGTPKAIDLHKVTLIYADNARGKSTLSSLMLACAGSDVAEIVGRKTVGSTTPQKVVLRFNPPGGKGAFNSEFNGVAWLGERPNLHVFNQAFVERNVYTSTGVLPEQREALLSLALGDAAVAQRAAFDQQAALQRDCAGKVTTAEAALQGYRGALTVDQFIEIQPTVDVDAQILEIDRYLGEAKAADWIMARPEFKTISVPTFDLNGVSETLRSSFESVSAEAAETAKTHFAKHKGASTERWVAEGLNQSPDEDCPFCGQPTGELKLLEAYKAYFDGSYSEHLSRVSGLRAIVDNSLGDGLISSWSSGIEFNQGGLTAWSESLGIHQLPGLNVEEALAALRVIRDDLQKVVEEKARNPLTPLDATPVGIALERLESVLDMAREYNAQVAKLNQDIVAYKAKLTKPDVAGLAAVRADLILNKNRYETNVVELVNAVNLARAAYKAAETAKDAARTALDKLMAETLTRFQDSINAWLTKFSAPFQIDRLAPTYKGGGVRSEYVLKVRGTSVNVGPGGGGQLSFHAALSEGDKRTLAFAFFLARFFGDPNRGTATVVLDDVFTSLDRHRRHNTVEAVVRMALECAQVIALGHDAHFLRELKNKIAKKKVGATLELALHRDGEDFSYIDAFDLDEYCSSDYYKHYVLVERFVGGDHTVSLIEVAQALRLLVEGHLHRCFPKKFKDGLTVGEMLDQIKNANPPNPLAKLHSLHAELVNFNDFAAAFHHDTSGGYARTEVNAAELLPFAQGALSFIQIRSFR
ncbi:AAA family ATPase [Burkholderia cepacia]|uniref:AAA family ATPase n=1 Tax=Burkholderia cepacia TaxID=292 RepID=UPI00398E68E4